MVHLSSKKSRFCYMKYPYQSYVSLFLFITLFSQMLYVGKPFSISSLFIKTRKYIEKIVIPTKRAFLPLQSPPTVDSNYNNNENNDFTPSSTPSSVFGTRYAHVHSNLRVLQFNMLADGLSGLRKDLGAFSRVKLHDIAWDKRKNRLLSEISQYDPDIITLQECDHYYDFFLPKLSIAGYDGLYAPKPASACLEVSKNADGCCIFVKRKKIKIRSSETLSYALSRAEVLEDGKPISEEDRQVRVQNQVAIVAILEMIASSSSSSSSSSFTSISKSGNPLPPVVIATTHLKALKTAVGEKYRVSQAKQLLSAVNKVVQTLEDRGKTPAVIITGDLNASPTNATTGYPALAYNVVKNHRLNLRSVLNDDVPINYIGVLGKFHKDFNNKLMEHFQSISNSNSYHNHDDNKDDKTSQSIIQHIDPGVWTTWKARKKKGQEQVARHCIDYILYCPLPSDYRKWNSYDRVLPRVGIRAVAALDLYDDKEISPGYLPNAIYPSDHISIAADFQIVEEF